MSGVEGQSCPKICQRCDSEKYKFYFQGSKIDSLVYQSSKCGHIFQINELMDYLNESRNDIERKCPYCDCALDLGFETKGIFAQDVIARKQNLEQIRAKFFNFFNLKKDVNENASYIFETFSSILEESLRKSLDSIIKAINSDKMKEFSIENSIVILNANNFLCLISGIKNFHTILEQEKVKGPLNLESYLTKIGINTNKYLEKFLSILNEACVELDEFKGDQYWIQLQHFFQKLPISIYDKTFFKNYKLFIKFLKKEIDQYL